MSPYFFAHRIGIALALVHLISCERSPSAQPAPTSDSVVATYLDGQVTLADVEKAIADIPAAGRPTDQSEPIDWYREITERVALDRIFLEEAQLLREDEDPEFRQQSRASRRDLYAEDRVQSTLADQTPPNSEEARSYYDEHVEEFRLPATRAVYHIFKRFPSPQQREETLGEAERLRALASSGQSFRILAETHSDSESRHNEGFLGILRRDSLPDDLARVVFNLAEGEISEVIVTRDGAHFFFNENTVDERVFSFEEAEPAITRRLRSERRDEEIDRIATTLEIAADHFIPNDDQLRQLLQSTDSEKLLLSIGAFQLNLGKFREIFAEWNQTGERQEWEDAFTLFHRIKSREIIYQSILAEGRPPQPHLEARIQKWRDRELVDRHVRKRLIRQLQQEPKALRDYFENNSAEFQSAPQVRLHALVLAKDDEAVTNMARLERGKARLERKEIELEQLGSAVGAEVQNWGWFLPQDLLVRDPIAARIAFTLEAGQFSYPYTNREQLILFQVVEVSPPEPVTFDVAYQSLVNRYLVHHGQALFAKVSTEVLEREEFHFDRDLMARWLAFGDAETP